MPFSKELIAVLDYLFLKFGVAVDWTNKTILPYIKELAAKFITYKIATSYFWIYLGICFLLTCLIIAFITFKKDFEYIPIICIILVFVSVFIICFNIYQVIVCKTFPEKVLFDYVTNLYETKTDGWR